MRFDEFEQALNQLLDERRSFDSEPEVARLIRESARHRALAASYAELIEAKTLERIDPLPPCEPPADLAARVLAHLRSPAAAEAPLARLAASEVVPSGRFDWLLDRRLAAGLALAAAVLLAIGLFVSGRQPGEGANQVVKSQPSEPSVLPAEADVASRADSAPQGDMATAAPGGERIARDVADSGDQQGQATEEATIGALATEARDKYAELARDTQKVMSEVAMLLPGFGSPSRNRRGGEDRDEFADGPEGSSEDWAGDVSDGLEPLTRSTVGALDFILKALPVESASAASGADSDPASGGAARTDPASEQ